MSDTTQQRDFTAEQLRLEMLKGLSRRLVGPIENKKAHIEWPGSTNEFKEVNEEFAESNSFPTGPWIGPNDEEVLPYSPFTLYSIGRLAPKIDDVVVGEINEEEAVVRDEQARIADEIIDVSDVGQGGSDGDEDEDVKVEESIELAANSLGVSIRIPGGVAELKVSIAGGGYTPLAVREAKNPWWMRRDIHRDLTFTTHDSSSKNLIDGDIQITIGCEVRAQTDGTRYCTIWATNNGTASSLGVATELTLFQVRLVVTTTELLPYEPEFVRQPTDLDLLYNDIDTLAIGHSCDVAVNRQDNCYEVHSVTMPVVHLKDLTPNPMEEGIGFEVGMMDLAEMTSTAVAAIERILERYQAWISLRQGDIPELPSQFQMLGSENLRACQSFLEDIRTGWNLVRTNEDIQRCLRDASRAMALQQVGSSAHKREVTISEDGEITISGINPHIANSYTGQWRPFQIGFILASLVKIVDPTHPSRELVDVIWMPTGGGKTEAYLGLAAFTILWEKLHQVRARKSGRNTKVYMRYTLRLLTVQQIQRASSLICALEMIRDSDSATYGDDEVRIGAWVGDVTPNSWDAAARIYTSALRNEEEMPFLLKQCPWCGSAIGKIYEKKNAPKKENLAFGYRLEPIPGGMKKRLFPFCPDVHCPFADRKKIINGQPYTRGLPIHEVDEDVYSFGIDFVVGTIDKVARMAWVKDSSKLLRRKIKNGNLSDPPALFIQDELHLVSGPLGSIDGIFEAMLEGLCEREGGSKPVIVAATATTKNFEEQIQGLYARGSRLVPPPGLSVNDSFFAKRKEESLGKMYVGVSHSGFVSAVAMQTDVLAAIAHYGAALGLEGFDPDPYWTNVVFFSSRRALGNLTSAVETTLQKKMSRMKSLTGTQTGGLDNKGERRNTRFMGQIRELTATASEDVGKVLDNLSVSHPDRSAIDLCFATSMVEVGLDVGRLGLMSVVGQPKSASQYIQVTGRVGRNQSAPGLVVTILNPNVARDRAHYEGFSLWHQRLYASVESASVTPFTGRALAKSVPTTMTAMARAFGAGSNPQTQIQSAWDEASGILVRRAQTQGPEELQRLNAELHSLSVRANNASVAQMKWTTEEKGQGKAFVYPMGQTPSEKQPQAHWNALMSMRNVDQDANFKVKPQIQNPVGTSSDQSEIVEI